MIMDLGYTYHCRVFVKSFLGPLDIPGAANSRCWENGVP